MDKSREPQDSEFARVVRYFLDHEKPVEPARKKPRKRIAKTAKKPSTKAKKHA